MNSNRRIKYRLSIQFSRFFLAQQVSFVLWIPIRSQSATLAPLFPLAPAASLALSSALFSLPVSSDSIHSPTDFPPSSASQVKRLLPQENRLELRSQLPAGMHLRDISPTPSLPVFKFTRFVKGAFWGAPPTRPTNRWNPRIVISLRNWPAEGFTVWATWKLCGNAREHYMIGWAF
jgi:hypothetical protein